MKKQAHQLKVEMKTKFRGVVSNDEIQEAIRIADHLENSKFFKKKLAQLKGEWKPEEEKKFYDKISPSC